MSPTVEEIKEVATPILKKGGVIHSQLFGSAARGDLSTKSDLDFLVEFEEGRSLFDLVETKQNLEDVLQRNVDLVSFDYLSERIKPIVKKELVVLF